jgi:hypothetical protein
MIREINSLANHIIKIQYCISILAYSDRVAVVSKVLIVVGFQKVQRTKGQDDPTRMINSFKDLSSDRQQK